MHNQTPFRLIALIAIAMALAGCQSFRKNVDSIGKWTADPITTTYPEDTDLLVLLTANVPSQRVAPASQETYGQRVESALAAFETDLTENEYIAKRRIVLESFRRKSNYLCKEYKLDLLRKQARGNFLLGTTALLFGTLGAVVTHVDTARALSGMAAFATGTRSEVNQDYFFEKTAAVLAKAIDKKREIQWQLVAASLDAPRSKYTIRGAIIDIEEYHATCSLSGALAEIEKAVDNINVLQSVKDAAGAAKTYDEIRSSVSRGQALPVDDKK